MRKMVNNTLDNHSVFFAVFFTQLTAIIAQGSLRSGPFELAIQVIIWGVMLGFSLAFAWSYIHKEGSEANKLPEQLTNIVAMVGMGAFFFQMVTSNITSAILLLLSWLLIALSFSFKTQRNLYFSLLASTILLLYAASISKSSSFIIYMVIYTLSAIIALASNYYLTKTKQQIISTKQDTGFPFKLPISVIVGIILLITATLYLLVPRPSAMNWGVFPAGGGRYQASDDWPKTSKKDGPNGEQDDAFDKAMDRLKDNGIDNKVIEDLKNSGLKEKLNKLKEQMEEAQAENTQTEGEEQSYDERESDGSSFHYSGFEKEASINKPSTEDAKNNYNTLILYMEGKEPQYLRGQVYDYFDGLSWKKTEEQITRKDRKDNRFLINRSLRKPYDQYTITMASNLAGQPTIFVPPSTAELQFPSNAIAQDSYGSLSAARQISKDTFYSVKIAQEGSKINGRPVDKTAEPSDEDIEKFTQLPEDISERFIRFSKKISSESSDTMEVASKIEEYLRSNYEYSLESVFSSQGKIPLEEFLFEKPLGHCEYFATAMVTLMRAQEIPARYVTGFSVTNFNPVTGYYEARGMDAHAWAEVWVPERGWVTFEATPPYFLPKTSEAKNTSESIEEYLSKRSQDAELTDPDSLETSIIHTAKYSFEQLNILLNKAWAGLKTAISWTGTMILYYGWLVLLLVVVVYSAIHYLRYYLVRKRVKSCLRAAKKKPSKKQLVVSYEQVEKLFALYKYPRPKEWTLFQYQNYLCQNFPELKGEIINLSTTLKHSLYQKNEGGEISLKEIKEAIAMANKMTEHKFKTPYPAEKQLKRIVEFMQSFSLKSLRG